MISTIITAVRLFGIGKSLAVVAVLFLTVGTAYGVWHYTIWKRGYDRAIADIANADERAIKRASNARSIVLDCKSRGLRWDQSTGICERR
jgi:hypothetical protein